MIHWTHCNKYQKYLTLVKEPKIKPHLPETKLFSKGNLKQMLNKYGVVFLKPIKGTGGSGIMKATKKNNFYVVYHHVNKASFNEFNQMYKYMMKIANRRVYLVQQGIELATIDNRPIDFRVLLLKPRDKWLFIGMMGKIAAKDKIVTNKAKGGKAITFEEALNILNFSNDRIAQLEESISELGELVGDTLSKDYRYVKENGMDIGLDKYGHYWIFETNSMPRYNLFKSHPNQSLYPMIDQYVRGIRRNYINKRI